jgi:hypothetical protein
MTCWLDGMCEPLATGAAGTTPRTTWRGQHNVEGVLFKRAARQVMSKLPRRGLFQGGQARTELRYDDGMNR